MTIICHLWQGISPFNIWDLPYRLWLMFAREADQYVAELSKVASANQR